MPTMMSAQPSRSISSLIAGVSALDGIGSTVPRRAGGGLLHWHRVGRPGVVAGVGQVAAVGGLEEEALEAESTPGDEVGPERIANIRRHPDSLALLDHAVQQPLALQQRHV